MVLDILIICNILHKAFNNATLRKISIFGKISYILASLFLIFVFVTQFHISGKYSLVLVLVVAKHLLVGSWLRAPKCPKMT